MKKHLFILLSISMVSSATLCMENDGNLMANAEIYAQEQDPGVIKITAADDAEFYVKREVAQVLYRVSSIIKESILDFENKETCQELPDNIQEINLPSTITQKDFVKFYDYLKLIDEELNNQLEEKLQKLSADDLVSFLIFANVLNVINLSDIKNMLARIITNQHLDEFLQSQEPKIEDSYLNKEMESCVLNQNPEIIAKVLSKVKVASTILKQNNDVISAEFNAPGDKIVTLSRGGTARIWDVASGQCLHILEDGDIVVSAEFNASRNKVVTASWTGAARIWDVESGECLKVLRGHVGKVNSAKFNTLEDKIITAGADNKIRIWDLSEFLEIEKYLKKELTPEQTLLLVKMFKNNINAEQIKKDQQLSEIFNSLDKRVQDILISFLDNSFLDNSLLSKIKTSFKEHPFRNIVGIFSAAGLLYGGWYLYKTFLK